MGGTPRYRPFSPLPARRYTSSRRNVSAAGFDLRLKLSKGRLA